MEETAQKSHNQKYTGAHGRRKEAVATVRLYQGPGEVTINGKPFEEYIILPTYIAKIKKVLNAVKTQSLYSASIKVSGSGKSSQVDAIILGLARALSSTDKEFRPVLKKAGFLTRDPRVKERRKFGNAQKARKGKQSPKR